MVGAWGEEGAGWGFGWVRGLCFFFLHGWVERLIVLRRACWFGGWVEGGMEGVVMGVVVVVL